MAIVILFGPTIILHAQPPFKIGIIQDSNSNELKQLTDYLKKEITDLTNARFEVTFKEVGADWQPGMVKKNIQIFMENPEIDIIITLGFLSSNEISKLSNFPKPVIAANIIDQDLQKLPLQSDNSTGVDNFSYIESLFQLKMDMLSFSKMFDIKQLAVLVPTPLTENFPQISQYLNQNADRFNMTIVSVGNNSSETLSQIAPNTDAAFVLPLVQYSRSELQKLFSGLNKAHIPSLAVSGTDYLAIGATVTLTPQFTFQQLARQAALRVLKISEGQNLSKIPVSIAGAPRAPVINMESIRLVNKFPAWNILNESILLNVTRFPGKQINLRMAIADALKNNLKGKISKHDVALAEKDVRIAKSNLLPHVDIAGSGVQLSDNLVESSMGQKGEFTITGSASLKQVIFSEPVFANIAIQKLAKENINFYNEQTMLDIVLNVSSAYISLLFTNSNLLIQNENVHATVKNLQLAKAKEETGQSGISDVNRWTSELNINKMKLNDAYTACKASMYQINNLLDNPIDNTISTPDSNSIDKTIMLNQDILAQFFENPGLTEKYADFVIEHMQKHSPELLQLLTAGKILERKNKSYKRQLFTPEIAAFAGVDQVFVRDGTIENPQLPIPPPPDDPTWNVGLRASFPLFEGWRNVNNVQKSKIELDKIADQQKDLLNSLETGIRSNVQKLRTSYLELELSHNAALAAEDNYYVVQDAYSQGLTSQVQLIDAQNVMTRTKHLAAIAYYQYVLDYIFIERLAGTFTFLEEKNEQEAYAIRLYDYLKKGE